ncbi:hypothetical protein D9613_009269 [Agrocybe pediades]|uniref:Ornithine cyclodeaminase n=1 Tax=Agrocybe pediades TaxID=84607 RepID=A0A8H4R3X2_9AGAR|nr:hypothetical protein D9613_009269 [Agrocybe pediades]
MSLLILSASDVDEITSTLSPESLQLTMANVFHRLSSYSKLDDESKRESGVHMPPRISIPTANHTTLFMPARMGPSTDRVDIRNHQGETAVKVVSVPSRQDDTRGLPGTTVVLDEETGVVKAVVNARKLTALRNAAGSLLSTTLVGPPKPRNIVAFGAGQQMDAHLDLHIRHFSSSISECTIINRRLNERATSLQRNLSSKHPGVVFRLLGSSEESTSLENSVKDADIIICATSSTSPLFPSEWVKAGTHVILIGSYKPTMHEVDSNLILRSIKTSGDNRLSSSSRMPALFVDSREACLEEAGELIQARIKPDEMVEIGELIPADLSMENGRLTSQANPRLEANENRDSEPDYEGPITVFKSVGIGLQDVAIASAVVNRALEMGIGTPIPNYDG